MVQQNPLLFVKIKKCNFLLQTLAKRFLHYILIITPIYLLLEGKTIHKFNARNLI